MKSPKADPVKGTTLKLSTQLTYALRIEVENNE